MKLAFKIVAICLVAMMLITSLAGYMIARRAIERAKESQQEDAGRLSDLIGESLNLAYQRDGQQGIVQAIKTKTVETGALRYRWVWFDVSVNDPDRPAAPMDSLDKVLAGGMDSVVATSDGGKKLHTYSPLEVNDQTGATRKGAIEVSGSLDSVEQETWRTIKIGLGAMAAMTLFCIGFVTLAGVRLIGRPLEKLIRQTRKIGDGDYQTAEQLVSKDEFGELSLALNSMASKISDQQERLASESAARVATLEQLRHADRLKTVGRLAAGLAHEIGTPLERRVGACRVNQEWKIESAGDGRKCRSDPIGIEPHRRNRATIDGLCSPQSAQQKLGGPTRRRRSHRWTTPDAGREKRC